MPASVATKNLFALYFAKPNGTKMISSGIGVAAAKNAAAAPYFFTNLSNGRILFRVFAFIIRLPPKLTKNMICFATVAVTADINASACKSYSLPTDIVARNKKPGNGTKGTREPKKLISAKIRYPSSVANGRISPNSISQINF